VARTVRCSSEKLAVFICIIEFDGKQQWCHANNLRKYNERVIEVSNHNCAIIFDCDRDFGVIPSVKCNDLNTCDKSRHKLTVNQV
jgi:hypothetical protein